jgi:excinuclease ABC subunit C
MSSWIDDKVSRLPRESGVYLFRDKQNKVIYVGKATDLRSRVRSYFSGTDPRPFVRYLDQLLGDIEFIVTRNPKEALLLENTLIKKHQPRFNFQLRDDKNYLSIRLDTNEEWPRVRVVRQQKDDGAHYFGPYHSASKIRKTVSLINRYFRLRTCRDTVFRNRVRPCLQHQIKRCPGPCVLDVDREAYMDNVHRTILFLEGKTTELIRNLESQMETHAANFAYEEAARVRDQLDAVKSSLVKQHAVQTQRDDIDVLGLFREGETVSLAHVVYRRGILEKSDDYLLTDQVTDTEDIIEQTLTLLYTNFEPPQEIIVPSLPWEVESIEEALSEIAGRKVRVHVPQRGRKVRLLETANQNAELHYREAIDEENRYANAVMRLKKKLHLRQAPRTIECYDISNIQGKFVVASQVTFIDGKPDKNRYRRYRIRSVQGQDDFQSLFEVLTRRAKRVEKNDEPLPDLMVIDGGKGQLNKARLALQELGVDDQEIISLAKSRVTGQTDDDESSRSFERVFLPNQKNAVEMRKADDARFLLERVRDEAHRFAIEYHRTLRRKQHKKSIIDEIPGIGPSRKKDLLRELGGLRGVKGATLAEIAAIDGFSEQLAWSVFDFFHPGEADKPGNETEIWKDHPEAQ